MMQEYHLISTAQGGGGWSAERPVLPQSVEDEATRIVSAVLKAEQLTAFTIHLKLIFAHMVECEATLQEYRPRITPPRTAAPSGIRLVSRRTPKFGTAVRQSLKLFQKEYQTLRRHKKASHVQMMRFMNSLNRNAGAFGILETMIKLRSGGQLRLYVDPTRRRDLFLRLGEAFADAKVVLDRSMKSGHSDPVFEQLVRALAALYLHHTQARPGRTVKFIYREDPDSEEAREEGRFLALCNCLAAAVCEALPEGARRDRLPKMVKVVRRICAELRAETAPSPSCNGSI